MSSPGLRENDRSASAPDVRHPLVNIRERPPCKPKDLRRSSSWPPAFSVYDEGDLTAISPTRPIEPFADLDLARSISTNKSTTPLTEAKSSQSVGKSVSSSTSPSSGVTLELKKEGFRASVSKRWSLTKQILHDKARLYREYYRAYQHIRHKSDDLGSPEPRKEAEKKDPQQQQQPLSPASSAPRREKESTKKEQQKNKSDKPPPNKGKITNSPHELSARYWQPDTEEQERGRQKGRLATHRSSQAIYPKGFSSRGELIVGSEPRAKRKSRTASGHRHAWREPNPAIVPVSEESFQC